MQEYMTHNRDTNAFAEQMLQKGTSTSDWLNLSYRHNCYIVSVAVSEINCFDHVSVSIGLMFSLSWSAD